ncbi:MAG: hypothetical protein KAI43_12630 [Candidatus Aureabacteria bacterium]|nr:hypothetical protein [Candidatus Auribacterota bacterium]
MKKKLLKPPQNNGEIFISPDYHDIIKDITPNTRIMTAHQPYFFNSGVSTKYLFQDMLEKGIRSNIFLDTDRIDIGVNLPLDNSRIVYKKILASEEVLYQFKTPSKNIFDDLFKDIFENYKKHKTEAENEHMSSLKIFINIFMKNTSKKYLKEVLAESFLEFYSLNNNYIFLSDLLKGEEFKEMFYKIYNESELFIDIFNTALDDYKKEYRFRFKNFPFPKLQHQELPFWIVKNNKRIKCFKNKVDVEDFDNMTIFPRASTLTIFLRLYFCDLFIHGIGGGNYEWVNDRIMKRFFKKNPASYCVVSGTFLMDDLSIRDIPYFMFSPDLIKKRLYSFTSEKTPCDGN